MSAQPALVSRATFTKEKIALLCLMNMVFERHSQDRNIPFEEIAARTKLPVDQVRRFFFFFLISFDSREYHRIKKKSTYQKPPCV